jgi:hypothetical protein
MKRRIQIVFLLAAIAFVSSCDLNEVPNPPSSFTDDLCFHNALKNGHIFRLDDKIWLRGGEVDSMHFDITGWSLRPCQLNLGLGREYFQALIEPVFVNVSEHVGDYAPEAEVIFLESTGGPKVYPLSLLNTHILINDEVDGIPVMVTYSILSDRAAVYLRNYCDALFTFAVSGYSYWDYNVLDATSDFLLWDRETESLWWPLIGKAVSGQMEGIWLVYYNESKWRLTSWQDVLENHPGAMLLANEQTMEIPQEWPRYFEVSCK